MAAVSISAVSAGLGGNTVNVNGIDFNVPDGFENQSLPDDPGFVDAENGVLFQDSSSGNFAMIGVGDKLPEIPENYTGETKDMDINGKQGTLTSFNTQSYGKNCNFFDYEQDNKKVRVAVFTDDDGQDLLKEIIA